MSSSADRNDQGVDRRMKVVRSILSRFGLQSKEIEAVEFSENCPFPFNNFIYKVVLASAATAESFRGSRVASDNVLNLNNAHQDGSVTEASEPSARREKAPTSAPSQGDDNTVDQDAKQFGEASLKHTACVELPVMEGVGTVIVRLSNPYGEGMNNTNRVENEVAAMHIARRSLASLGRAHLVPRVFAWQSMTSLEEEGFGWIIMEYMEGKAMDEEFKKMSLQRKRGLVEEIAEIFHAVQNAKLPAGVDKHGGLTINEYGQIVSGEATLVKGGPWESYEGFLQAKWQVALGDAETEVVQGWKANGVRERVDEFLHDGKHDALVRAASVDVRKLCLVHSDFTMNNMLFDPEAGRITALLDFDWVSVTHPFEEFWTSFHDIGGCLSGLDDEMLRKSVLSGEFAAEHSVSEGKFEMEEAKTHEENSEVWELAKTWNDALKELGATRPSDIVGINVLERLGYFRDQIAPFDITSKVMIRRKGAENLQERRNEVERVIIRMLNDWMKNQ